MSSGKEFIKRDKISKRLTHLLTIDRDQVIVHPVVNRLVSKTCHTLGDLCLVMREKQVKPSSMNIKWFSEVFCTHCRKFGVPAGKTFTPGRRPMHNVFRCRFFPDCKIQSRFFLTLGIKNPGIGIKTVSYTHLRA